MVSSAGYDDLSQIRQCTGCDYFGNRSYVGIAEDMCMLFPDKLFIRFFPFCDGKDPLPFSFWLDGLDCQPNDRFQIREAFQLACTIHDEQTFSSAPLIVPHKLGDGTSVLYSMAFHGGGGRPPSFCIARYPGSFESAEAELPVADWSCLDSMNEAVIILRSDARVYWANNVAQEMLSPAGMKEGAPVSSFMKRVLWEDGVCPMMDFIAVSRDTMPRDVVAEDARGRFWSIRTGLLGVSKDSFSGFIQTAVEITEWMDHRAKLDEVRQQFTAFMENLPSAALILGLDGAVEYCNPYMKRYLCGRGYITENGPCILPPDMVGFLKDLFPQVLREGHLSIERKHSEPEKYDQVFGLTLFPIRRVGEPPLIGAITVDLTNERKNERERAAIADTLMEAQKVAQLGSWDYHDSTRAITFHGISPYTLSPEPDDVSLPLDEFLCLLSPDDAEKVKGAVCDRFSDTHHELTLSLDTNGDGVRYAGFRSRNRTDGISGSVGTIQDLTERILAERAYSESENRFRSYFNSKISGSMIIEPIFNEDGYCINFRFIAVNQAFCRMTEADINCIIGKTVYEIFPEDAYEWVSLFSNAPTQGSGSSSTSELTCSRTGKVLSFHIFHLGSDNHCYGCSFIDKSYEKEALRVLQENDEFLSIIFPSTIEGIFVIDSDTHVIQDANETACSLIEAKRDEIIGRNCREIICPVKDGLCPVTDLNEEMNMVETVMPGPGGEQIPVMKSVKQVVYQGRNCLIEMIVDLRKVKAAEAAFTLAEERYRMVFETSPDGILITDTTEINEVNPAFAAALGYVPEDMEGCSVLDYAPKYQGDGVSSSQKRDMMLEEIRKGSRINMRWDALNKDGNLVHFEIRGGLMNVLGKKMVVIIGRDITGIIQMEGEQREALDQIEENLANLATLNDHIRNPLTVISAYTEMDASEHASIIMGQIKEIDAIINTLDRGFLESEKIRGFLRKHHDLDAVP